MKNNFMISVIIAAYNASKYLRLSVSSVLSQTYQNFEIIIVDDGSTDETSHIVKKLQKDYTCTRIIYIYQNNKGPASARNLGIYASSGEYVAILDADDLWDSTKLERQVSKISDPKNDIILSSIVRFHGEFEEGNFFNQTDPPLFVSKNEYFRALVGMSNMHMANFCSILVPRSVIIDAGCYDECLITAEDWDLWIRIAKIKNCNFINIYVPLVYYRKYSSSLTMRHKYTETLKNQIYILEKHLYPYDENYKFIKNAMMGKVEYFFNVAVNRCDRLAVANIMLIFCSKFYLYSKKSFIFFIKCIYRIIIIK